MSNALTQTLHRIKTPLGLIVLGFLFITTIIYTSNSKDSKIKQVYALDLPQNTWYMSGANPQRTSWTASEVSGQLSVSWYRPFDAYIPNNIQPIIADDVIYVSTSRGLYAMSAINGTHIWTYATELPLGNSPTISNGVAYVGGTDKALHAINITNGQELWSYSGADAAFVTNPIVANNMVYLGNRDGYFYAIYSNDHPTAGLRGTLAWKTNIGAPINISAAYKNSVLYFAASDSYAYALNATDGTLTWKSPQKLPVTLMQSFWPVIYTNPHTSTDTIVFSGNTRYRMKPPGTNYVDLQNLDANEFLGPVYGSTGEIGPRDGNNLMDISSAADYLETPSLAEQSTDPNGTSRTNHKPWRRTVFVLDASTGAEITFDVNSNSIADYAPFFWFGTRSGMRYPAVVGNDGLLYLSNTYYVNTFATTRGQVVGWDIGTPNIKTPFSATRANDEPLAYASGGNNIYYSLCCDRAVGAASITGAGDWLYYEYSGIDTQAPGYNIATLGTAEDKARQVFGNKTLGTGYNGAALGQNGVYGYHGEQSPPIPYVASDGVGRVYTQKGNAIVVFSSTGGGIGLPNLPVVSDTDTPPSVDTSTITSKLESEVTKIIAAGHLRPGYSTHGGFDPATTQLYGDDLTDYFHNSADTFLALSNAYQYVSTGLQDSIKTYLASELSSYSPCENRHNGWQGASRDSLGTSSSGFDLPPDIEVNANSSPINWGTSYAGWNMPPYPLYAIWKYAQATGVNPSTLLSSCGTLLNNQPSDSTLQSNPEAFNAWISGYQGYVELAKLASQPYATQETELNRLLALRASTFPSIINYPTHPDTSDAQRTLAVARNFMYLTPELATYLNDNVSTDVLAAYTQFNTLEPYWMIGFFNQSFGESSVHPLTDQNAMFNAKAWIFDASRQKLNQLLDAPNFVRGDMYYIQHLTAVLDATPAPTPTPDPTPTPTSTPTQTSTTTSSTNQQTTTSNDPQPQCTDSDVGGSLPWLYGAIPMSNTSILLYFTHADAPVDHYALEYGLSSGTYTWGADNIGPQESSTYLVQSLKPNTIYYFRVRAGNGCKTGAWSNELSARTHEFTKASQAIISTEISPSSQTSNDEMCKAYVVQTGDTLWSIANELLGSGEHFESLIQQNIETYPSLKNSRMIDIGWSLQYGCNSQQLDKNGNDKGESKSQIPQQRYNLNISVKNTQNIPIANAKVTIHSDVQEQYTNEQGVATFTDIEGGNHELIVEYDAYKGNQFINVQGGDQDININITVEEKATQSNLPTFVIPLIMLTGLLLVVVIYFTLIKKRS